MLKNIFNTEINNHKVFQIVFFIILAVSGDNQNPTKLLNDKQYKSTKIYSVNKFVFLKLEETAKF